MLSKIRAALKRAGYKPEKRRATRVPGYHDITPGYRLTEKKEQNPDWYGFRRMNPPRWIETGIFQVSHTHNDNLPAMLEVLKAAGFEGKTDGYYIIIDTKAAEEATK